MAEPGAAAAPAFASSAAVLADGGATAAHSVMLADARPSAFSASVLLTVVGALLAHPIEAYTLNPA